MQNLEKKVLIAIGRYSFSILKQAIKFKKIMGWGPYIEACPLPQSTHIELRHLHIWMQCLPVMQQLIRRSDD